MIPSPILLAILLPSSLSIGPPLDGKPASVEFAGRPMYAVAMPQRGSSTITLQAPTSIRTGYFALVSNRIMPGTANAPEGQLVKVLSWSGSTATLDRPLSTDWRGDGVLVDCPVYENVVVDGFVGPQEYSLLVGGRIRNGRVPAGWDVDGRARAIRLELCRDTIVENNSVEASLSTAAGRGYAYQDQRGDGNVWRQNRADGCNLGISFFGGGNGLVDGFRATNCRVGADLHGYGSYGHRFVNVEGGGSDFAWGNQYPWGDRGIVVEGASGFKTLYAYGSTAGTVTDSVFLGPLVLFSNQAGAPESVTAVRCAFKAFSDGNWLRYMGAGPFTTKLELRDVVQAAVAPPPPEQVP